MLFGECAYTISNSRGGTGFLCRLIGMTLSHGGSSVIWTKKILKVHKGQRLSSFIPVYWCLIDIHTNIHVHVDNPLPYKLTLVTYSPCSLVNLSWGN